MDAMDFSLEREHTLLLVVDIQERLAAAMNPAGLERLLHNTDILLSGALRLGLPVLATEQYPKGLGPTVPALRERLQAAEVALIEKLTFSCLGAPEVEARLDALEEHDTVILVGVEAHVCVYQTALELLARGLRVHVPADAVLSRTESNLATGLRLCERAGAVVTSTETVLFQLLGRAGTDEFKELSKLVK